MAHKKFKNNYTIQDLDKAIEMLRKKEVSIYRASRMFKIPESTIRDKLLRKHPSKIGRKTKLTAEEEAELEKWLVDCAEMGDPKPKFEILKAAAEIGNIANNSNSTFTKGTPSHQWFVSFMKRHPNISIRTTESISRASAVVTQEDIERFFDGILKYLKKWLTDDELHELMNDPSRWGNSDETGFELNPKEKKGVAKKGAKTVYRGETSRPKEQITTTYTFLANGEMIDPVLLFKDSCSKMQDIAFALGSKF